MMIYIDLVCRLWMNLIFDEIIDILFSVGFNWEWWFVYIYN